MIVVALDVVSVTVAGAVVIDGVELVEVVFDAVVGALIDIVREPGFVLGDVVAGFVLALSCGCERVPPAVALGGAVVVRGRTMLA